MSKKCTCGNTGGATVGYPSIGELHCLQCGRRWKAGIDRKRAYIFRQLAFWARMERRARRLVDLENRRRVVDTIHAARREFIRETIPALYGEG